MAAAAPIVSIVGATGRTAGVLLDSPGRLGNVRLRLVGRNGDALRRRSEALGGDTEWTQLTALEPAQVEKAVAGSALVLSLAGPFAETAPAVARAAIETGASYVDIANERPALEAVYTLGPLAARAGVTLLPGAGFGTVATEGLAVWLAGAEFARRVEVALLPESAGTSAGVLETILLALAAGGGYVTGGQYRPTRLGRGARALLLPDGQLVTILPADLGDLASLPVGYGTPEVSASVAVGMPPAVARALLPVVSAAMRSTTLRSATTALGRRAGAPARKHYRSHSWARVTLRSGEVREGWLTAGEGYRFTADSVSETVRRTLLGDAAPGAATPIRAFGSAFLEGLPGVRLERSATGTAGRLG
jgi:short subunit dehydrogenase-like uncharacterized protein